MTDKAETELKACPFCGGEGVMQIMRGGEDSMLTFVQCKSCEASLEAVEDAYSDPATAAMQWNTRPTQTADAVEAVTETGRKIGHIADAVRDAAKMNGLGIIGFDVSTRIANHIVGHIAALSTSDDSGDREGVELVADLGRALNGHHLYCESLPPENGDCNCNKASREIPTPQDSGLADEFEAVLRGVTDNVAPDEGVMIDWRLGDRILTVLRQPRNDGELLRENHELCAQLSRIREAINYSGATTDAYLDDMVKADRDRLSLRQMAKKFGVGVGRIRGSLARLDQGEG